MSTCSTRLAVAVLFALSVTHCRFGYDLLSLEQTDPFGGDGDSSGGIGGAMAMGGSSSETGGAPSFAGSMWMGTGGEGVTLPAHLVHRYSFDGSGTRVVDSAGNADGEVLGGAALDGDGKVTLSGGTSDEYIQLPSGLISSLEATTLEAWVHWDGPDAGPWQRIFDFGNSSAGAGLQASTATTHFSLGLDENFTRLLFDADPQDGSANWREHWSSP